MGWVLLLATAICAVASGARAAVEIEEGRRLFLAGQYLACAELAGQALKQRGNSEEWQLLLAQALLARGHYTEARTAITNALEDNYWSVRLRWQAHEVLQANGHTEEARKLAMEIVQKVSGQSRGYRDAPSIVAFGQAALVLGADPKRVLDTVLDPARKAGPKSREVHLAVGQLALEKHDYALAARRFQEGLKQLPEDPDLHFGLGRAYMPSDPRLAAACVESALERNSNHVGSLLLLADHRVDAEDYTGAEALLERVRKVNPNHPEAWAYRAVIAHLRNQPEAEAKARAAALSVWPSNPRVDHLIGLKLSQAYRFAEGAACQRRALEFDTNYLPAKAQLALDLLRLGEEAEGWKLAAQVHAEDGYDVEAFNLVTLKQTVEQFTTLTNGNLLVRMNSTEAALYGPDALQVLERARSNLCAKYGLDLKGPVTVEIFPDQKDFAVRTFGIPGDPGYLGVCFGTVVTANSPAARPGDTVNWQAVLYHEFCHVVTLQMTRNKMPRWLSEGISVYEELQANPAWGQRMNPRYRDMILEGQLTAVSKMSGAFLAPPTPLHLQFAYYQASLVVEFLVGNFGMEKLKAILADLGNGQDINNTIARHTVPLENFEAEFAAYARKRADQLAPGLDWTDPGKDAPPVAGAAGVNALSDVGTTNFYVLRDRARRLADEEKFEQAKAPLRTLVDRYPTQTGPGCAYALLALAHRRLGETNEERQVLARFAEQDDEALEAYRRLMELAAAAGDWVEVERNAQRYLAVNPLVAPPWQYLAQASEKTGATRQTIRAYRALLQLDPLDPAQVHFGLARALHRAGDPAARRHVLQALEEAPRYREALQLLLEINNPPIPTQARLENPRAGTEAPR